MMNTPDTNTRTNRFVNNEIFDARHIESKSNYYAVFGRLPVEKAQRLSESWAYHQRINCPMTLAEIATQQEPDYEILQIDTIGFRRAAMNN